MPVDRSMKFELNEKEKKIADAFMENHGCTWTKMKGGKPYFGATGHPFTYVLSSSSLFGWSATIKCACGKSQGLYDDDDLV